MERRSRSKIGRLGEMSGHKVAVIIPCYNGERFLGQAIKGVLRQTQPVAEIIVVDDGSSDGSVAIARSFKGVRCIEQRNAGVAAARNTGFDSSSSEFVWFLDADDRPMPDTVAKCLAALLDHPDWAFVSGEVRIIDQNGAFVRDPAAVHFDGDPYAQLLRANHVWTPGAVLYRREAVQAVGGFSIWAGASADYEINLKIARNWSSGRISDRLIEYRVHGANMSGDVRSMLQSDVRVRREERRHACRSREERQAWREGYSAMTKDYGGKLIARAKNEFAQRRWKEASVSIWHLVRYYPWGMNRLLLGALRALTRGGQSNASG